jgi:hypothetical protein
MNGAAKMKPRKKLMLALAISALLLVGLACTREVGPSGVPVDSTAEPVKKELTDFSQIAGTNYLIAGIFGGERSSSGWDFSLRSGSGYGYEVYNYIFFDMQSEQFHALLPSNEYAIVNKIGLPLCCDNSEKNPIKWWLYYVVKADTNQDKLFSSQDKFTLSISDVGGNGYIELIPDIDGSLGQFMKSDTDLLFFYRQGDKKYYAKIDLQSQKVVATVEYPSFGSDVK